MSDFRTSDLQLASYLVATEHSLRRLEGPPGRRVFVFDGVSAADRFAYFQDTCRISPRRLFNAHRDLKKALFETA